MANLTKHILKLFCLFFTVNLVLLKVNSYPQGFFGQEEFDDDKDIYFGNHHHHDFHHHHNDKNEHISDTLVLSHVIFRHGNRTPDSFEEMYPNDPYLNETYYPYGLGQLTNAGKLREYSIGTSLRKRYSSFLNEMFLPEEVEAVSTDYNRTKASLELVLAGLFRPQGQQVWNQELMWQPVPYNYVPRNQDTLLLGVLCPNYLNLYQKIRDSLENRNQFKLFRKVSNYISRYSGLNVTSFEQIYNLYFGLSTEEEYGFNLPEWTQKVWPKMIVNMAIKQYYVMTGSDELQRIASGYLLKKILDDTTTKISQKGNEKKIYLYSAHENNVAQFLILLDVFRPHIPNYGSHILVEVHKINGEFGIKIFYQNYETEEPQLLKIPNCEEFCRFDKFVDLFRKYIPKGDLCGNN